MKLKRIGWLVERNWDGRWVPGTRRGRTQHEAKKNYCREMFGDDDKHSIRIDNKHFRFNKVYVEDKP